MQNNITKSWPRNATEKMPERGRQREEDEGKSLHIDVAQLVRLKAHTSFLNRISQFAKSSHFCAIPFLAAGHCLSIDFNSIFPLAHWLLLLCSSSFHFCFVCTFISPAPPTKQSVPTRFVQYFNVQFSKNFILIWFLSADSHHNHLADDIMDSEKRLKGFLICQVVVSSVSTRLLKV